MRMGMNALTLAVSFGTGLWILATHRWRDNGRWVDAAVWKD